MIKITEEQYNTRTPNSNANEFNNLSQEDKTIYLDRLSKYYSLFIQYLNSKMNLEKIDKELANSEMNFTSVKKEDMDLYQYLSSESLNYLYLRSNIYIERLNDEGLAFLDNASDVLNDETTYFIENTYPILISEVLEHGEVPINYGPAGNEQFFAPNENIIIGFRFDSPVDSIRKMGFIDFLKTYVEVSAKNKGITTPVNVIKYDNWSVNSLKSAEEETNKR